VRSDLIAGATVAAYLVPQVLAYAEVAGLPAVAGLWAALAAVGVYALLGSSRQLSVGPESTTAIMTATTVAPLAAGDPNRYAALAATLALLVGAICLLGRAARLGFIADLLSRPVLVGYLAGIALIMIVGQLENVTGVPVHGTTFVSELRSFMNNIEQVHWPTLALAAAVLVFLTLTGALLPHLPGPLLAMLLAAAATAVLSLREMGVQVVGAVPGGLPRPELPAVDSTDLVRLVLPAVGVAIVAYSDNVLTGRAFAARHGQSIDADQEMFALGAANFVTGFLWGFPVSSSGSRTVVGNTAGGRSQLASLVTLLFVMVVLVVGVLYGVLVAVALSILDLLRHVSRPHDGVLGFVPGLAGMHDVDDYPDATTVPGLVVYRYDAPLCFANAENFKRRSLAAVDATRNPRWLLLNMEAVIEVDVTAADAMHGLCDELDRRRVVPALARVKQDLIPDLRAGGLIDRIGPERIFPTLSTAVQAFRDQQAGTPPAGS